MPALLEHVNYTVSNPEKTAQWMQALFGWHIRWQGAAMAGGRTTHVGTKDCYVALYTPPSNLGSNTAPSAHIAALNHIAVIVDDLDATEAAIIKHGFKTSNHGDYEPGRRFYFHDHDNIEYEVVSYS